MKFANLSLYLLLQFLCGACSSNAQDTINIDWFIPGPEGLSSQTANVGDTVFFEWNSNNAFHNVFIHPSGDCSMNNRIFVGNRSPTTYVFTEADAEMGEIVFACDVRQHCEFGQLITFDVLSAAVTLPFNETDDDFSDDDISGNATSVSLSSTMNTTESSSGLLDKVDFEGRTTDDNFTINATESTLESLDKILFDDSSISENSTVDKESEFVEIEQNESMTESSVNDSEIDTTESATISEDSFAINWFIPGPEGLSSQTANVGDTVIFEWNSDNAFHNVFIHPSGDCSMNNRIFVGNRSPTTYVFTEADAEMGEIVFACDVRQHCEFGQLITFDVLSAAVTLPFNETDDDFSDDDISGNATSVSLSSTMNTTESSSGLLDEVDFEGQMAIENSTNATELDIAESVSLSPVISPTDSPVNIPANFTE